MQTIEDLISPLIRATEDGSLSWEADGTNTYSVALPHHKIAVWNWTDDDDGSSGVSASLQTKATFPETIDLMRAGEFSSRYETLYSLFSTARRSALNVDAVITSIREDIASLKKK